MSKFKGLVTPNGITKGAKVIWAGRSQKFPAQNGFAAKMLKEGEVYEVEFVFPGDPMQIELVGDKFNELFVYDLFKRVG